MSNIIRAQVSIRGTRTLLQHAFGPEAIPLTKGEKTGVAGNDPEEWKRTRIVNDEGRLFLPGTYIFGCLKNGAVHTKKGRGSIQSNVVSTLQVEEDVILLNRKMPPEDEITSHQTLSPEDPSVLTFIYVSSVRNPATKGRNVRYRLATRMGWKAQFTLQWDKTVVSRELMKAVLRDSGVLGGLGDGVKIGCGRFEVLSYVELEEVKKETVEAHEGNGAEKPKRRKTARV